MSLAEALAAATINSAHSIGRGSTHGSIQVNKVNSTPSIGRGSTHGSIQINKVNSTPSIGRGSTHGSIQVNKVTLLLVLVEGVLMVLYKLIR